MIVGVLIRQALLLAAVIDENDEEIGAYASVGIQCLNNLIQTFGSLSVDVPYKTNITVNLEQNLSQYAIYPVITEILEAQIITTLNVISPLSVANDKQYNLWNLTTPISKPNWVYLSALQHKNPQSGENGSLIYFYPLPSDTYIVNMLCKMSLPQLTIFTDLNGIFPSYAFHFFEYALAREFVNRYGTKPTDDFYQAYREAKVDFEAANPQDFSIQNDNPLQNRRLYRPWSYYVG